MYAKIPCKAKPSKVASKDQTRPILTRGEIVETDGSFELVTTNSYALAVVPLEVVNNGNGSGLTAGPISAEALAAAEKSGAFSANGDVQPLSDFGGDLGQTFSRETPEQAGRYPNYRELTPEPPKTSDRFTVQVDAKLLMSLAQALGASGPRGTAHVRLTFDMSKTSESNDPNIGSWWGKPIVVETANGSDAHGLLMPIRPTS